MTVQIPTQPSTPQPAGGPDAPGGTPYPDIADTSHATAAAAAFFHGRQVTLQRELPAPVRPDR